MDMMELRRRILLNKPGKYIGGIYVLVDNCYYNIRDHGWNEDLVEDSDYFLTGWYDTGSTSKKSYTAKTQYKKGDIGQFARFFNDKNSASADYWSITAGDAYPNGTRTFQSVGRWVISPIYKPWAADSFFYNNTDQCYLFKGRNV